MARASRLQDMRYAEKKQLQLEGMSENHKQILKNKKVKLMADLDVDAVLLHLQANDDFFTSERCAKIKAGQIIPDKVERLLDQLEKGSELTWICLMNALDSIRQGFIRAYLEVKPVQKKYHQDRGKDRHTASPRTVRDHDNITFEKQPNLTVKQTTDRIYKEHKDGAYPMHKKTRGSVCIINVKIITGSAPRYGTDVDRDNLVRLFEGLHFKVVVYNDKDHLTAEDIRQKLKAFAARPDHKQSQCAVLCLMSHGEDGFIFGTDGKKVNIMEIRNYFNNENCPALMNKPKLFFFQACRGDTEDFGVCKDGIRKDGTRKDVTQPTHGDMLIGFPTPAGYVSLRDTKYGSWYMSALVKVFSERAWNTEIYDMMMEIRNVLANNVSPAGEKQSSEELFQLKKKFYFFPGISD